MYMAIFTHTFCPIAPTKNSNKKGHFPHEIHAKNVLFTYSHQPDSLEMYFSNQPDNLYYPKNSATDVALFQTVDKARPRDLGSGFFYVIKHMKHQQIVV